MSRRLSETYWRPGSPGPPLRTSPRLCVALRAGVASCALLALFSCRAEPTPLAETIVARLGPELFSLPVERRGPVVQIGREARPVLVAPREQLLVEAFGIPVERGRARIDVELPASSLAPNSVLSLRVQVFSALGGATEIPPTKIYQTIAERSAWRKRDAGWRLTPSSERPAATVLEIDMPGHGKLGLTGEIERDRLNLRLLQLLPGPVSLESLPFDVPQRGRLHLGYGRVHSPPDTEARFRATLDCPGRPVDTIVDERVAAAEPRWYEAEVALPAVPHCAVSLAAHDANGRPVPGALWSVPQVRTPRAPRGRAWAPNLVLVSLDTLRADHLSGYGYARETSPVIDARLIERGATFTDVSATYTMTDVSHLSIFSSLYPATQPERGRISAQSGFVLLAEALRDAGFETVAFAEDALLTGHFGFWFGFDRFGERAFSDSERGGPTIDDAVRYLRSTGGARPFFLFVHTYKTHDPYLASEPYASLWREGAREGREHPAPFVPEERRPTMDAYDRTIREADALVGRLLDGLAESGLESQTLVVVLSDHGEAFGEHGMLGHGFGVQQEQLRVPLVLRGPGIPEGVRLDEPASLVDVLPTLLELLGLDPLPQVQGVSLAGRLRGSAPALGERPLFFAWRGGKGVRFGRWKFWRDKFAWHLYDLDRDPHERESRNDYLRALHAGRLLASHTAQSAERRAALGAETHAPSAPTVPEQVHQALRALGYVE